MVLMTGSLIIVGVAFVLSVGVVALAAASPAGAVSGASVASLLQTVRRRAGLDA